MVDQFTSRLYPNLYVCKFVVNCAFTPSDAYCYIHLVWANYTQDSSTVCSIFVDFIIIINWLSI